MKVLDLEGLGYFWTKIKNKFYIKPDTGIPKSDLSSEVQGSLNKADTALQTETDPIFTASPAHGISSEDIVRWNNLESLGISTLSLSIDSSTYVLTLSGTKVDGTSFVVPNPIDFPLESVVVSGSYDSVNKKVILTLKDGSTIEFSIADLISGLQEEITPSNKLSADLIEDGVTNKVVTQSEKTTWNNKSDFSGSYNDLTDKPHIPNDQIQSDWDQSDSTQVDYIKNKPTNVSDFTNDAGYLVQADLPTNHVTTDTTQDITGEKTFIGNKIIKFKQSASTDKLGFTGYNTSNVECGNFEILPSDKAVNLGIYAPNLKPNKDWMIGFKYQAKDSAGGVHKFGLRIPPRFGTSTYTEYYLPVVINGLQADNTGSINIPIPTVPTNISAFTNDVGYLTEHQSLSNYYTKSETDNLLDDKADISDLATVATSGDYNDLTNKPTIPSAQVNSDWNATSGVAQILNKPDIPNVSQVANTGTSITVGSTSYNVVTTYSPSGNANTYTAPSWSAMDNACGELDFRTHVDDTSIGVNTDDELYVKSLSADKLTNGTNNKVFTSAEQLKLTGIEIGAQVNVQSDWNETNVLSDAYILNKPTIPDITGKADKVSSAVEGNFASLDSNGNLEDSGYSYTDCLNELSDQYAPATESSELEPGDTFEEAFGKLEKTITDNEYVTAQALNDLNTNKQDTLESGTNIKTINGESILGSGDFNVTGDCIAYPSFEIDSNGHLIMSGGQQGLFTLENGHLMYNF